MSLTLASASLLSLIIINSASVSAFIVQNVTLAATDPSITYLPPLCYQKTGFDCRGTWSPDSSNPNYYNGTAVTTWDTGSDIQNGYLGYSFTGSAIYVYEWLSTDSAAQVLLYKNTARVVNLTASPSLYTSTPLSSTPQLVLAWALTGLDPTQSHTIGIQHQVSPGHNTSLTVDRFVVSMTIGAIPQKEGLSTGAKAGIAVGVIFFVVAAGFAWVAVRGMQRRGKEAAQRKNALSMGAANSGVAATGAAPQVTLKWMAPSSELEASERLAREGIQEEMEKA